MSYCSRACLCAGDGSAPRLPVHLPARARHAAARGRSAGDPAWIRDGLAGVPPKIRALGELNKLLAHRPWAIGPAHIEARIETKFIFEKNCGNISTYVPVESETIRCCKILLCTIPVRLYYFSTKKIPRRNMAFSP
jgi:hypothetical protein